MYQKIIQYVSELKDRVKSKMLSLSLEKEKREVALLLESKMADLGRSFFEKSGSLDFEKWGIPSFLQELELVQNKRMSLEEKLDKELSTLSETEKEFSRLIQELEKAIEEKSDRLKVANGDLYFENKLAKVNETIQNNERRKQRAKEFKTFVPIPMLDQQKEKLKNKQKEFKTAVDEKSLKVTRIKEDYLKAMEGLKNLKRELKLCREEIALKKSRNCPQRKEIRNLNESAEAVRMKLRGAYKDLGFYLDGKGLEGQFPEEAKGIFDLKEKIAGLDKKISILKQGI